MKTVSPALLALLNAARGKDFPIAMADCFSITLVNGLQFFFTNYDVSIDWNGQTFIALAVLIQGLKFKVTTGLEVDRQQITMLPCNPTGSDPSSTVSGAPWLVAIRDGALDGATIQRDRVFMDPNLPNAIDGLTLFRGRVSTVDAVGRTSAKLTVASPLVVLDYSMPHNIFSPTCLHVLYDSGCTLNKDDFLTISTAGVGSTQTVINSPDALTAHVEGTLLFNSGLNTGLRATVKSAITGVSWTLMYPAPILPAPGDQVFVYFGCDHTFATCGVKFNNAVHFRGFPNVPPADYAL